MTKKKEFIAQTKGRHTENKKLENENEREKSKETDSCRGQDWLRSEAEDRGDWGGLRWKDRTEGLRVISRTGIGMRQLRFDLTRQKIREIDEMSDEEMWGEEIVELSWLGIWGLAECGSIKMRSEWGRRKEMEEMTQE